MPREALNKISGDFFDTCFVVELLQALNLQLHGVRELGAHGHALAIGRQRIDRAAQITAGNQIVAKKMSVRETESLVKKLGAEFNLLPQKPKKEKSRDLKRVEEELSDLLTAEVEVRVRKRIKRHGRIEEMGEVVINFGSLDELNGLIERLRAV